jgi:glycosyltransferase involved in cell wall biosynthesis
MRVLHYLGTNVGMTGVETFLMQLCGGQRRLGVRPQITCELDMRDELVRAAAAMDVPVHGFPARTAADDRLPQKIGTARLRARRVRELVSIIGREHIDVLHLHAVGISGLDAFVAGMLARVPAIVVTHHATLSWFGPIRKAVDRATFALEKRFAKRIVMPYAAAAEEMIAHGAPRERMTVVPFCVDETRFTGHNTPPEEPGALRLVMVARIVAGKGHAELLEAVAKLLPRHPKLRLSIVGDGPVRPEVDAAIARLGIGHAVEVTGWVAHGEVPALLRSAHVVMLPSYMPAETFPLSLMEGMALGLPAIGARWFGIPDIIVDGVTGFVVEPRDADDLARAIDRFASSAEVYANASKAAAARVQRHFTAIAVARTYQDLYERALRN